MSYEQIDNMSMADCSDQFDYWEEWPPQHILSAKRYLQKKPQSASPGHEQGEFNQQLAEVGSFFGGAPEPTPPHLSQMGDWAEEQIKLMHSGKRV